MSTLVHITTYYAIHLTCKIARNQVETTLKY